MSKPTCFISYCHSDTDPDVLEFLIAEIQSHAHQKISFYFDKDLPFGERFTDFMNRLHSVEVILVMFTPDYKRKTLERIGGVYTEYKKIVDIFDGVRADPKDPRSRTPSVIPIILGGTRESSVPAAFEDARFLNLAELIVRRTHSGNLHISEAQRGKFEPYFKRIASQIIVKDAIETEEYRKSEEKFYDDLFVKLKAGEKPIPEGVLLETSAYKMVQSQTSFFVIGRKGTGKSTLTRMLQTLNPRRYADFVGIRADNINLELAYGQITEERESDLEGVLKPLSYFQFGWLGFFALCMIDLILRLEERASLLSSQSARTAPLEGFHGANFAAGKHGTDEIQTAMFTFATQKVGEFFENCIRDCTTSGNFSTLLSQVISKFTASAYLQFLLGNEALEALEGIVDLCGRKVLLTLDDFDTVFDAFRRRARSESDRRARAHVEIDWLRSLLVLVNDIKSNRKNLYRIFQTVDFCLTIPQDRFTEIERSDRDGYRYNQATANILWSGIELCELIVLRLQKLSAYNCRKTTARERFEEIMREKWAELPVEITFTFNGFPIRIPLFNYILRHTFWRPRDVLLYFGSLLAAAMNIREKGEAIDSEVVRRIISETTRRIIATEFLKEYEMAIYSIEHVIKAFTSSPQAMVYEDIEAIIGRISFGVAAEDDEKVDMDRKIELLYEIGFLGVQLDQRYRESLKVGEECFYFNEGKSPLRAMKQANYRAGKFVVHPIFAEYLLLDYSKNNLLLNLSWDYIVRTHSIIVSSARGW